MAKWGAFKWSQGDYGVAEKWQLSYRPFDYRVAILDRNGNILRFLRTNVDSITWEYSRNGGCGDMALSIRDLFDDYGDIQADYEVQIWIIPPEDSEYKKVYSGYVYDIIPNLDEKENIVIRCAGYASQLDRIVVRRDDGGGITSLPYNQVQISSSSDTTEAVVNDIMKNHVAVSTDIIYDHTKIDEVTYAPDEFKSGDNADKMIKELASMAGNYEYGVDVDKTFFFRQKSTSRAYNFMVGDEVTKFRPQESFSKIKNRVILKVRGDTVFVLEREGDLAIDQQQGAETTWQAFGTDASRKLKQKFLPNRRSLSKISLKAQYQGFTEYISDGDMEEYQPFDWETDGATTAVSKNSDIAFGDLSLKVVTIRPGMAPTRLVTPLRGYGTYQPVSSLPDGYYTLRFNYYISMGDMFCQVWNADTNSLIVESERYTTKNTWMTDTIGFEMPSYYDSPGPTNIEIRFYSALRFVTTFYVDNVSLKPSRDGVKISIAEDGETEEIAYFIIDQPDWSGTVSAWVMRYPMDRSKIHNLYLERTRSIEGYGYDNTNYYQVRTG